MIIDLIFLPTSIYCGAISWLKGVQIFLYLDLRDGYFHVPIAEEDVYKMVFFLIGMVHLSFLLCYLGL